MNKVKQIKCPDCKSINKEMIEQVKYAYDNSKFWYIYQCQGCGTVYSYNDVNKKIEKCNASLYYQS